MTLPNLSASYRVLLGFAVLLTVTACGGGGNRGAPVDQDLNSVNDDPITVVDGNDINGGFSLELSSTAIDIAEGGEQVVLIVSAVREDAHSTPITLAARDRSGLTESPLSTAFTEPQLSGATTQSELRIRLDISRAPIQAHTRELVIVANEGFVDEARATVMLNVRPTAAADVYLLIGQSNMIGASLPNSKEAGAGQQDAPNERILQLNVTGNDDTNFPDSAAFTNPNSVANPDQRIVRAVDPLHDGFNFNINGKTGTRVGLGLSFAKAMLPNTSANIVLVPAAWSDTGFCRRDSNPLPGLGWNATRSQQDTIFAGTLLHDRAITRLNVALEASSGIFRGILWHQGEADANSSTCAEQYANNLSALVASIRSKASIDARGSNARGADADIPFIVGTMSQAREFADLSADKATIDRVHRLIAEVIPFASAVINDDLVPPAYACGQGSCIHFGATAYREMGARYAAQMRAVQYP